MAKHYFNLSKVLKNLLSKRNMRPADLANAVNLPRPTIHRLLTGKSTRPHSSSLMPIAEFFSVDIEQLLGEKPLTELEISNKKNDTNVTYVPLIEWDLLSKNALTKRDKDRFYIPFSGNISEKGFATIMPDTSMEPFIQRNSILIFDPDVKPTDRSFVLAKIYDDACYIVRELLVDGKDLYLKPVSPNLNVFKTRSLNKDDEIIAFLVETRVNYSK